MNTPKSWEELKEKWGGLAKIFGYDLDKPDDIKRLLNDSSVINMVNNEVSEIMMKMMEKKQFRTWLEECIERCLKRINDGNLNYTHDNETIMELCSDMDKLAEKMCDVEDKIEDIDNKIKNIKSGALCKCNNEEYEM